LCKKAVETDVDILDKSGQILSSSAVSAQLPTVPISSAQGAEFKKQLIDAQSCQNSDDRGIVRQIERISYLVWRG
jgi:hypothetical protein